MPTGTENQGFLGRSILSIRRNQVASMEGGHEQELEDIELFTKHIGERFHDLSWAEENSEKGLYLSLPWLRKLLDAFLCCEAEFKANFILRRNPAHIAKPPFDRLITEMLDRAVKALDVCNAITHGIDCVHHWQKQAEIAVSALEQRPLSEGQFRRAKKALTTLVASMNYEDKDGTRTTERSWSFGRRGSAAVATTGKERNSGYLRSLSWSVSKTWSASKQLQAMAANLAAPRGADMNGLALPIYTMSTVLVFVSWVLVAAIPCQDRGGLNMHFHVPPKQLAWAGPMISIQEKIAEDWRKKEKKGSAGLTEELQRLEKCSNGLIELGESIQFPLEEEKLEEIRAQVNELADTCQSIEEELVPFQRQVRELFHGIVRSRTELLEYMSQVNRVPTQVLQ